MTSGLYRRIYAGFLTGKRINSISIEAEAWFWRLHAIADDFGNLHGDSKLLCSLASPRRTVTVKQVSGWAQELIGAGLIVSYQANQDSYFNIVGFDDKQPAGKNGKRTKRFPDMTKVNPGESRCSQEILAHNTNTNTNTKDNTNLLPEPADAGPARKVRSPKQIERDDLWEAVKDAFYASGVSKDDESLIGRTVTALKAKQATPEEIPRRLARWPMLYPEAGPLTPPGLAKHWDALSGKSTKPMTKPRRNEGIENEADDHAWQRAMRKWSEQGNEG